MQLFNNHFQVKPTTNEALIAKGSGRILAESINDKDLHLQLREGNKVIELVLPTVAAKMLVTLLTEMGEGNIVSIMTENKELSTGEAARILCVSRPFFVKLLEEGAINFRKVGKHRRVKYKDVTKYQQQMEHNQLESLQILASEAQKHDLGY